MLVDGGRGNGMPMWTQEAMHAYTVFMKFLLLSFLLLIILPSAAFAAKVGELPPPTTVQDIPESQETVLSDNNASLNDELKPGTGGAENLRVFRRKDGTVVEEYSIRGRVYMIRVKPPGNLPAYYLYDDEGNGKFERRLPGGYKRTTPPTWVIKRF